MHFLNQCSKAGNLGVTCPELLQLYFGVTRRAALQLQGGGVSTSLCPGHCPGCTRGGDWRVRGFGGALTPAGIRECQD